MKFIMIPVLLCLLISDSGGEAESSSSPNPTTHLIKPSDQLGAVVWSKKHEMILDTYEQIWVSAHRPTTGVVTLLHEYVTKRIGAMATKAWATYDLAPGETIHISGAVGSTTKLVFTSNSVPNGPVKIIMTEQ